MWKVDEKPTHRQVLEEPSSHDICGHFREDPPLLVVPPVSVRLVLLTCAGRGHASIETIACRETMESSSS